MRWAFLEDALLLLVFGAFWWAQYDSNFWDRHRWIGFGFGVIFAVIVLRPLRQLQAYRNKYLLRRDCLRLGILGALFGVLFVGKFVFNGKSTDGFLGVVVMATGIQYLYYYRRWSDSGPSDVQVSSASGNDRA